MSFVVLDDARQWLILMILFLSLCTFLVSVFYQMWERPYNNNPTVPKTPASSRRRVWWLPIKGAIALKLLALVVVVAAVIRLSICRRLQRHRQQQHWPQIEIKVSTAPTKFLHLSLTVTFFFSNYFYFYFHSVGEEIDRFRVGSDIFSLSLSLRLKSSQTCCWLLLLDGVFWFFN